MPAEEPSKRMTLEQEHQRWQKLYGEHEELRSFFREAYADALAPSLAGVIDFYGPGAKRILVVGGGKGRFSRELLPKIKELLKQKGKTPELEVVESDLTGIVRNAPGKMRVRADVHALPFKEESFDLVVGESMIHQGGPERIGERVKEIARVLKPKGTFVHVQDLAPSPNDWAPSSLQPISKLPPGENPLLRTPSLAENQRYDQLIMAAHAGLIKHFHAAARGQHLSFAVVASTGEKTVPRGPRKERVAGVLAREYNKWYFKEGRVHYENEQGIPKDRRRLHYSGIVSFASKHDKVSEIINHVMKWALPEKK